MRPLPASLALVLAVTACDRTSEPSDPAAPALRSAHAPAVAGRVVRFHAGFFAFLNFDPVTNLFSVIGLPDDPADTPAPFCDGPGAFEVLDWQIVVHPDGPVQTQIRAGAVNVHVYDATAFLALFDAGDLCGAVSLPRLAQGTGRLQYTDNDFAATGSHANSWGWRVHGTLDLTGGGQARYLDRVHGVFRPTGELDFTSMEVRLTPIG